MQRLDTTELTAALWRAADELQRPRPATGRTIDLRDRLLTDGVADQRHPLHDAIQAANRGGGARILLPGGNIKISGTPAEDPAGLGRRYLTLDGVRNVRLEGQPGTRLITDGPDVQYALLLQNAQHVRLERIGFSYLRQPTTRNDTGPKCLRITGARDLALVDIEVSGSPQYGIGIEGSSRVLVLRCFAHDTMADGVNANGCSHVWFLLNRTRRTGDDGLAIVSPEASAAGARGERSIIALNAVDGSDSRGVFAMGHNVIVAANAIDFTSGAGIGAMRDLSARDPGMPANGLTIVGNFIRHASTLNQSNADGPNGHARRLHGTSSGVGAIQVSEAGRNLPPVQLPPREYHRNITVLGNVIRDAGWAPVMLHGVIGACIERNEIDNPNTYGHSDFRAAVWLRQCRKVQVGENTFYRQAQLDHAVGAERSDWGHLEPVAGASLSHGCSEVTSANFQGALRDLLEFASS